MTGRAREYDYKALKLQWIRGDMSLRRLCELNNVKSASAVIKVAREENWAKDRAEFQTRSTDKTLTLLADREARRNLRVTEVEDNAIDMADEAISQIRGRMKQLRPVIVGQDADGEDIVEYDPVLALRPGEVVAMLKGITALNGGPGRRGGQDEGDEDTTIRIPAGRDFALMSRFVENVRARGGPTDEPFGEGSLQSGPEGSS